MATTTRQPASTLGASTLTHKHFTSLLLFSRFGRIWRELAGFGGIQWYLVEFGKSSFFGTVICSWSQFCLVITSHFGPFHTYSGHGCRFLFVCQLFAIFHQVGPLLNHFGPILECTLPFNLGSAVELAFLFVFPPLGHSGTVRGKSPARLLGRGGGYALQEVGVHRFQFLT